MGRRYSRNPSPRGYSRRYRSPSPMDRNRSCGNDLPTSILVRNLRHDCREPRGFGFLQYLNPDNAVEAKNQMDGQILLGHELTVVYAEKNRKKPSEMRKRERTRGRLPRYSRSPSRYRR